jgi:branched-chain amino acid aminotransferase
MSKNGVLLTPHADACLPGITRKKVIRLAKDLNFEVIERNISVTEFYNADEVFTTGTMGELTPVVEIDGRKIENRSGKVLFDKIFKEFRQLTEETGEPLPF